jgi:hypothetical protein
MYAIETPKKSSSIVTAVVYVFSSILPSPLNS